jgi:hypothetical protein
MKDSQREAMERLARLDDELGLQPKPQDFDEKIFALQMYDRVNIVADLIVEHWLEGNANPPKELMDAYFDAVEMAQIALNGNRLHESVVRPNGEFYEEIHSKFGLDKGPLLK